MSEFLQFGRIFDKDGRGVESEPSSASATPMDVDAVGKGKGKGCFVCGRPGHAAKDCKVNQANGKAQGKGKAKNAPHDKNSPAKFEGEVSQLWQATSGQNAGSVWQKRQTRKSTPLMERRRLRRWRQWKTQVRLMKQEFEATGPMMRTMELTPPKHGF